ncbi:carbohydrate ABC transporter permease [Evansella sp. AB-rgal1]|uniref:carbohydrate ABC transporter permease n=1 Tax=Evansella sp. AB-rgal1 TaxID=3242696 RepID=UPI00359E7F0A
MKNDTNVKEELNKRTSDDSGKKKSLRKSTSKKIADGIIFTLLSIFSISMVLPFVWMISTSLKTPGQTRTSTPEWIPDPIIWTKYVEIWEKAPLLTGFMNSTMYAVIVLSLGTFFTALGAFAFAKLKFPGREKLFLALLGTMMIPFPALMIPHYILFVNLGWIDSLLPLIIPAMLGNVFMMFFLRQFMNGISDEIIEAAKIDGSGFFGIFWKIMLPMIKPAIAAQVILWFMNVWNDYVGPLIYLHSPTNQTLPLMIANFNAYYDIQNDFPLIMAASLVSMIPLLIVFFAFQRHFVESMNYAGVKG